MMPALEDVEEPPPPITVLLLRSPVSMTKGTDPYHDAFGSFCLPSFASSALESGTSTPLPSMSTGARSSLATTTEHGAIDLIRTALTQQAAVSNSSLTEHAPSSQLQSATGRRKGKFIHDQPRLMTHHLSYPADSNGNELEIEYCVTSFAILAHEFVNQEVLIDRLLHGYQAQKIEARGAYRGMIVTSQRAVEAYVSAGVKAQDILRARSKTSSSSPTQWTRVPFFAVGPATSSALRSVPLAPWLRPRLVMGGEATGTGETLARYVIRHFTSPSILDQASDSRSAEHAAPLLYLVGDKNAPTIPDMLSNASPPNGPVPYEELQVYKTAPDPHFAEGCEVLANTLPSVVSRPPSRRPSHSSSSRNGSRRPSSGSVDSSAERTTNASRSSNPSRKSSADDLHFRARSSAELRRTSSTSSHRQNLRHVPSVGTPLGVSTMTSTEPANKRLESLAINAAAGSSPQMMASPATIEPEAINPIEEESVLSMLRSKANNSSGSNGGNSGALQCIARPDWVVFFSPSGVNYALEEFRRRKWMPPDFRQQAQSEGDRIRANTTMTSHASTASKGSTGRSQKYPRIAVLGSTTRAWMVENLGIEPDAVAAKPGPKELKDAIEEVELRLRSKA